MKPETEIKQMQAGYRPPIACNCICMTCGAVGYTPDCKRKYYFCRRHQFYVHSHGICPSWSSEKFVPVKAKMPSSPYTQCDLFK